MPDGQIHSPEGDFPRDWGKALREGEMKTGQDLYSLLENIIIDQNTRNTQEMPEDFSEKYWDPKAVGLRWKKHYIDMSLKESEEGYSVIDIDVSRSEDSFQLRKYKDGDVKAFWYAGAVYSGLLDEDIGEFWKEIPLSEQRVKRIAQVFVAAHARTMIEASGVS